MKERPILFSGEIVRAILESRKTQTRRVVKPQPKLAPGFYDMVAGLPPCPYGQPGDRLWVREAMMQDPEDGVTYAADGQLVMAPPTYCYRDETTKSVPSIHMPRWASRITLEIVSVRAQLLQDISKQDCMAEGMNDLEDVHAGWHQSYAQLWDSINAKRGFGWDKNPWVWVIEFKRVAA